MPLNWPEGSYELGLLVLFFGSFLGIGSLVFFGTQLGVKGPCGVVHDRGRFFENHKLIFVVFIQQFSQEWLVRHK